MRYIVFDQARHCGWALFDDKTLIDCGVETLGSERAKYEDILYPAFQFVEAKVKETQADVAIVEAVQYQSNFATFSKLSMLLGIFICFFKKNQILFEVVEATKWKSYCGIKGKRREEQKQNTIKFVKDIYGIDVESDAADAVAMGHFIINNLKIEGA